MKILGIETSCDETAAAIMEDNVIRSSIVYSQTKEHLPYGGIVPEIASRAHIEKINTVVYEALGKAGVDISQIDLVAATAGPGLIGALAIGFSFGRGLAMSVSRPFMGIHHIEAHLLVNNITHDLKPPYLALIISGGHTELVYVPEDFVYKLWGKTRDDAAGEAFDKIGKMLGLDYPAGGTIGMLSREGDKQFMPLPRPLKKERDFSFSGLKTAVYYKVRKHSREWVSENISHICASTQEAIVDSLLDKTVRALEELGCGRLVLAGGVARNERLREKLGVMAARHNFTWYAPEPEYCTDNAAMIAAAAWLRYKQFGISGSYNDIFPSMEWYDRIH